MLEILMWIMVIPAIIGVILNVYKKRVCFYFWLVANTSLCFLNCCAGAYAQAFIWALYAGLAIWGLAVWKESETETKEIPFTKKETRRLPGHRKQRSKR